MSGSRRSRTSARLAKELAQQINGDQPINIDSLLGPAQLKGRTALLLTLIAEASNMIKQAGAIIKDNPLDGQDVWAAVTALSDEARGLDRRVAIIVHELQ